MFQHMYPYMMYGYCHNVYVYIMLTHLYTQVIVRCLYVQHTDVIIIITQACELGNTHVLYSSKHTPTDT